MGRVPSQRLFTVIGTFAANSEVDGYQMLTNIDDASRLMRYPLGISPGWRLWLDKPLQVDTLSQQTLPPKAQCGRTGASARANCSRRCAWKNMMGLLLSLIVAVDRRGGLQHYYLAGDDGDEAGAKWRSSRRG